MTLVGLVALGGAAFATPFDLKLGPDVRIDGGAAWLAGRSVSAAGPHVRLNPGLTINDLMEWELSGKRISEPSSAFLLGLGLLGLTFLSGRKFDVRDSAAGSSTG